MPFPSQTFANIDDWESWVDLNIIPNGMELITGDDGNITENAAVKFIKRSPLNWEKAKIESAGGVISASRPVVVFITTVPTSFTWPDNIYNEYVFVNTTSGNVPLLSGTTFYNINLVAQTFIPAKSTVNIVKADNDLWIIANDPASGGGSSPLPPLIGIVDGGGANDPVSGTSIFQDNVLIGLGSANSGKIQIFIDGVPQTNFGVNSSFTFDNVLGQIDIDGGLGNTWQTGSGLYIDLNQ